jgi:hypothetical protein
MHEAQQTAKSGVPDGSAAKRCPENPLLKFSPCVRVYSHKSVSFKFRGFEFEFALSQGLFSSADIDTGTRFLLKVFSRKIDETLAAGLSLPRSVLDAGSGAGVLGICAARVLEAAGVRVRAQDRDELARVFTEYNAALNGIPSGTLTAHTEPLLAGPPEGGWDLILSNVPAKTGEPVLLDFIFRSMSLLKPGGQALVVVVNTLAALFRRRIGERGGVPAVEEKGREHTVFLYGPGEHPNEKNGESNAGGYGRDTFLRTWPDYFRGSSDYRLEDISYHIDAFYGVADFDTPSGAVMTAVKLFSRITGERGKVRRPPDAGGAGIAGAADKSPGTAVLVHEPAQGHFPVWLAALQGRRTEGAGGDGGIRRWVFSGRNILALEAARYNTLRALGESGGETEIDLIPAVDIALDREALAASPREGGAADHGYGLIAVFPDEARQTGRWDAWWDALAELLSPGGILLAGLSASGADRFDRRKPGGFTRLGEIKRKGFRALGYRKTGEEAVSVTKFPQRCQT